MKTALLLGAMTVAGVAVAPASAAVQIVNVDGVLTGATGVSVGGSTYNVAFASGTCASAYGACEQSRFSFSTSASALLAAQALLDQVFLDSSRGRFDTDPTRVFNCGDGFEGCDTYVAYGRTGSSVNVAGAFNGQSNDFVGVTTLSTDTNTNFPSIRNFAIFTAATEAAVPEPATWAMMIGGFGMVGGTLRRRRNALASRVRFA